MRLEDEIMQKKFKSEHHKLLVNIIYTGNWVNAGSIKFLKQFGISPQQYNLMRILRGRHPETASVTLLTERMLDKMSNASRLVEKLKKKGLVERIECPDDRRKVEVSINDKGLELLKKIDGYEYEKNFKNLSAAEAKQLNKLLDKFRG
ncbi:MAG: transcriptional regulator [Ignavibacteria bacterium GWB2_35_12]|nr:MAG: transcriptional regulator [Ignavibacteria bacterium GWA2_35_8]OGU38699.1 MAG: transcriptional regulator [Ignavibacteria bacterium GWB2_35_12]OGU88829.1 MAG: transcriptional regulator [Ignavibacteria bacterium RIFOXYA2_FULL_35_10]OGV20883.1 MAG: transcriptional regulator [Ignavibacteria bacterium RIFOXYC2_FULL_35_21]